MELAVLVVCQFHLWKSICGGYQSNTQTITIHGAKNPQTLQVIWRFRYTQTLAKGYNIKIVLDLNSMWGWNAKDSHSPIHTRNTYSTGHKQELRSATSDYTDLFTVCITHSANYSSTFFSGYFSSVAGIPLKKLLIPMGIQDIIWLLCGPQHYRTKILRYSINTRNICLNTVINP